MDKLNFDIDIGACWSRDDNNRPVRIICLDKHINFCCRASNYSNIMNDSGKRACCTYEEYADQHWVTMAVIHGFTILLAAMFALMLCISAWFYLSSCGISEAAVKEHRRKIIGHLLRSQILNKSHHNEPSILGSLKRVSRTLSSSSGRSRHSNKRPLSAEKAIKKPSTDAKPKRVRFISH